MYIPTCLLRDMSAQGAKTVDTFSLVSNISVNVFAARCYASAALAIMRSLCVCVSVAFVDHVKMNKHIFKIFSPSGSHTILIFPYQKAWQYSDGNPLNGGVECRWGRQKS